jgi:hypothetical protein
VSGTATRIDQVFALLAAQLVDWTFQQDLLGETGADLAPDDSLLDQW